MNCGKWRERVRSEVFAIPQGNRQTPDLVAGSGEVGDMLKLGECWTVTIFDLASFLCVSVLVLSMVFADWT